MNKNKHRGSDFRDFLNEEGILGEVEARALKQAVSLQLGRLLKEKELTKTEMAARMKTSRAVVDRLLDASNSSVTLNTPKRKAARALGPQNPKLSWSPSSTTNSAPSRNIPARNCLARTTASSIPASIPTTFIRQHLGHRSCPKPRVEGRDENKAKGRNLSIGWTRPSFRYLGYEDGKPVQYIAIRADITERKRAEETHGNTRCAN